MSETPYNSGWQANLDGEDRFEDNPFPRGSSEADAWETGWEDCALREEIPSASVERL